MSIFLKDLEDTLALGRLLGAECVEGTTFAVLGDLGAGKTSLAQGVAQGLGVEQGAYVNSPTFTIHQRHPGRLVFHHIDLYRLSDTEELVNLGLREVVGVHGVSYVEWPSRAPDLLPSDSVWIRLEFEGEGRRVKFAFSGDQSRQLIEQVCRNARSL